MLEHVLTHPTAQITCIDPFLYLPKEQLFDENTSSFKQKIIKIKGHSQEKLRKLPLNYYDFIYINGSHIASDVLEDAILSFRLLKDNGILIFDNCRQKKAIDAFLTIYSNRIQLLQKNYRIVLQKLGPLGVTKIPKITSRMADSLEVAIITQNRAPFLKKALLSIVYQTVLPKRIIVVDNNSYDNTMEIAKAFSEHLPIYYVFEPQEGIPFARNRAIDESKEEILAFLDDDCEASPYWVKAMIEAHKKNPAVIAIQGRSVSKPRSSVFSIVSEFNRRKWLWNNALQKKKRVPEILVLDTRNASLKAQHIKRLYLRFDTSLVRGSDSEFGKKLLSEDQHILFYQKARVYHRERNTLQEFLEQSWQKGRTSMRIRLRWPNEYLYARRENKPFLNKLFALLKYTWNSGNGIKIPLVSIVYYLYNLSFQKGKAFESQQTEDLPH